MLHVTANNAVSVVQSQYMPDSRGMVPGSIRSMTPMSGPPEMR